MLVKRLILVGISLIVGIVVTFLITLMIGTNPTEYGSLYFFFTSMSLALALAIWLDKFMGTEILPE